MYDPYKELDFNDESGLVDELQYANAVYNHEHRGMTWDELKRIFPDNGPLMEERYKAENEVE